MLLAGWGLANAGSDNRLALLFLRDAIDAVKHPKDVEEASILFKCTGALGQI